MLSCGRPIAGATVRIVDPEGRSLPEDRLGEIAISAEKDDLLVVYGQNYFAHEIEACVNAVPGVIPGRCVALGRYNEIRGSQDAVVIAEHEPGTDPAQLQREVKRAVQGEIGLTLAEVATVARGWLVKTTSGKISRAENLAKLLGPKEAAHA